MGGPRTLAQHGRSGRAKGPREGRSGGGARAKRRASRLHRDARAVALVVVHEGAAGQVYGHGEGKAWGRSGNTKVLWAVCSLRLLLWARLNNPTACRQKRIKRGALAMFSR